MDTDPEITEDEPNRWESAGKITRFDSRWEVAVPTRTPYRDTL